MSPKLLSATSGKTIVLLGRRGAGKTRLLTGIARREADVLAALRLRLPVDARVGFCSHVELLHGHLTARENLRLAAAAAGVEEWRARTAALLPDAPWNGEDTAGMKAALLPRGELRLLTLAMALLADPALLLIDDLGRGLSRPAQGALWRQLCALQQKAPRLILYATRDLHVARRLNASVWLVADGKVRARWCAGALPAALNGVAAYGFTMERGDDAAQFVQRLSPLQPLHYSTREDGLTVNVAVHEEKLTMLELATAAGPRLAHFSALQAEVDLLPEDWYEEVAGEYAGQEIMVQNATAGGERPPAATRRNARVAALTAWSEWRRFFQEPVRVAWLLAFNIVLLSLLAAATREAAAGLPARWIWLQAAAAAPGLLLSRRAAISWQRTTAIGTPFKARRTAGPGQTMALLGLFELAGGQRGALVLGLGVCAYSLVLAHGALFQLSWLLLLWQSSATAATALATVAAGQGLVWACVTLGLATLLRDRRGEIA